MAVRLPTLAPVLLLAALAGGRSSAAGNRAQAWVSASARAGDGSRAHPFQTVNEALASGARTVFVGAGRYPERVELAPGTTLVGSPGAVLADPAGEKEASSAQAAASALLTASGGAVRGLAIDASGALAVRVRGPVRFEQVQLSVHGANGVSIEAGSLEWNGGGVAGVVGARTAVSLAPGTTARFSHLKIEGPFAGGILAERADLSLTDVRIAGSQLGVRLRGERARLERVRIEGGKEVGLFVGPGSLEAKGLVVSDHEYGVLAGAGAELVLRAPTLLRNRRAGLAVRSARLVVEGGEIADSGDFGGVQLSNSHSRIEGLRVVRSLSEAVSIMDGEAQLRSLTIDGVRDPSDAEGEGVLVRRGHAILRQVSIAHVSGLGLFAAEASTVEFDRLRLADCAGGSVAAEAHSRIDGKTLLLAEQRDPELIATRKGELRLEKVEVSPPGSLEVHCEADAPVHIVQLTGARVHGDRCLTVERSR